MTLIVAAVYAAALVWLAWNSRALGDVANTANACFAGAAWTVLWAGVASRLFAGMHSTGTAVAGTALAAGFLIAALVVGRTGRPVYGAHLTSHRRTNAAVMVAASATFAVIAAAAV